MNFELTEGVIWLIIAILSGIIEAITLGITTIWFVFGALVAWLLYEFNAPFLVQLIAFISVSAILLYFTKPLVERYLHVGKVRTNADSLIGEIGIVIEDIDTIKAIGQVEVKGQIWSAKTRDENLILKDTLVEILAIEGVKLIVSETSKGKKEEFLCQH